MAFKNPLSLSEIDGVADPSQLPSIDMLTGTATPGQIPFLQSLNGQMTNGQLPDTLVKNLIVGPVASTHLELIDGQLSVIRPDINGQLGATAIFGGATGDRMQLISNGGSVVGFDENGNLGANAAAFNTLNVGGQDIITRINNLGRGLVGCYRYTANGANAVGSTEKGYFELDVHLYPNRTYRIDGMIQMASGSQSTAADPQINLRYTANGAAPTISSTILSAHLWGGIPNKMNWWSLPIQTFFTVSSECDVRILVSMIANAGSLTNTNQTANIRGDGAFQTWLACTDVGPNIPQMWTSGQLNNGGTPPPNPVATYTKYYLASWTRTWQNGGIFDTNNNAIQGYYSPMGQMHISEIGFPQAMFDDIAGSSISEIRVYLKNLHWYYNGGGIAQIRPHNHASLPSSVAMYDTTLNVSFTYGEGKEIVLPSSWYSTFASGGYRGIALSSNGSNDMTYYGRFNGIPGNTYGPYAVVTYTK